MLGRNVKFGEAFVGDLNFSDRALEKSPKLSVQYITVIAVIILIKNKINCAEGFAKCFC